MSALRCAVCGATGGLKACSRCHSEYYCSAEHQRAHWKAHKPRCSAPIASGAPIASTASSVVSGASSVASSGPSAASGASAAPARVWRGTDSAKKEYGSVEELWQAVPRAQWYSLADSYWKGVPPTVDGMLGGLSEVDAADVRGSRELLRSLKLHSHARALDCGAGIGRVTRHVLAPLFDRVDLVDQCPGFVDSARAGLADLKNVGRLECCGLQDLEFGPGEAYDVVWVQWVIIYLTDDDLVRFVRRCAGALAPGGVVCVKDNVTRGGEFWADLSDNSIIRSDAHMRALFARAGVTVRMARDQTGLPKDLFPVKTYVLASSS
eukprot:m51a1_g11085 hypothetical protein (322) ;mRNA; f:6148-7462